MFLPVSKTLMALPTVLITRPAHQAAKISQALRLAGYEPLLFPTIEIRAVDDLTPLDEALQQPKQFQWLILTSINGVDVVMNRLTALSLSPQQLITLKIAAIGPATAVALETHGLTINLMPTLHQAEGLLDAFMPINLVGQRILLPQADIARPVLAEGLRQQGAIVKNIAAYHTAPLRHGALPPSADIVTFTSSSTVEGYVNCLQGTPPTTVLAGKAVICIGPITAETAAQYGVPVTAVANPHTVEGVITAIQQLKLRD